jgi:hypothetical protein
MCAVSVIQDYFRQRTDPFIPPQPWPRDIRSPMPIQWTIETWALLKDILKKLEELDVNTGQPDCEDPAKAAWMPEVEKRLATLEEGGA